MYNEGLGVNVDFEQALYWYTLASESDQPEAIFNLGLLYLDGNGVTQHSPTALDYFERAEELAVPAASYMLGTLQLSGEQGVPINLERDEKESARRLSVEYLKLNSPLQTFCYQE